MTGHVFVLNGDLAQVRAHAVGYSTSTMLGNDGHQYPSFARGFPDFPRLFAELPRPCSLGTAHWLPLGGADLPAGLVIVAAAGRDPAATKADRSRLSVENAIAVAVRELRKLHPAPARLRIALPTFRVGMGGDRHARLASAKAQIQAAHDALRDHPHVDVAFVAYKRDVHRVFLQARRDLKLAPRCPAGVPAPSGLVEALREGRCVAFIGAGMSAGAGLPGWGALIDGLSARLQLPPNDKADVDYYLDLAQWFVERHGRDELCGILRGLFGHDAHRPTFAHYLLMALPLKIVITTNYDGLLERTLRGLRRWPVTIVDPRDVVKTGRGDGVCVVKFHGDAATGRGVVLSRDDYDGFFRQRPAMALLLEGLLLNQTFLFAGYGLRDPNFRQIYSRIADMLSGAEREAYALTVQQPNGTSALAADQWQRKGLHLLPAPGDTPEERFRASDIFLDWLADQVTLRPHDLFLANDVPLDGALVRLQDALVNEAGSALEATFDQPLTELEVRRVAEVLAFLADQGYRPAPGTRHTLATMWEHLAGSCTDVALKRRLLVRALKNAERGDRVERLQRILDELA